MTNPARIVCLVVPAEDPWPRIKRLDLKVKELNQELAELRAKLGAN